MNKIEYHDTDETCNYCGETVQVSWGRMSCQNMSCEAYGAGLDGAMWDDDVDE